MEDLIKKEIKKLTPHQKSILSVISNANENNYILEVFDIREVKSTYTVTNGEDDFLEVRNNTMEILKKLSFMYYTLMPSSDIILRQKHYISKKYRDAVFLYCP